MPTLRVVDFTPYPGGRFVEDGPYSGEEFRNDVLLPALRAAIAANEILIVELDGTKGYGSSFLEEAFGGLIRKSLATRGDVSRHLQVTSTTHLFEPYKALALRYIDAARPERLAVA